MKRRVGWLVGWLVGNDGRLIGSLADWLVDRWLAVSGSNNKNTCMIRNYSNLIRIYYGLEHFGLANVRLNYAGDHARADGGV